MAEIDWYDRDVPRKGGKCLVIRLVGISCVAVGFRESRREGSHGETEKGLTDECKMQLEAYGYVSGLYPK